MSNKIKRGIAGVVLAGTIVVSGVFLGGAVEDIQIEALPDHEKLVVTKDKIITSKEYLDERGVPHVVYQYKGDVIADEKDEIVEERTTSQRVYRTEDPEIFTMRVYSKGTFQKDDTTGEWTSRETATTTKDAFDLQVLGFIPQVFADTSSVYETKDTFYGTAFLAGPNDTNIELSYGGWADHYYSYVEWDLTGTPTSAQTTDAKVYFKSSTIATNWADVQIRLVTSSWAEATLTRTNLPTDAGITDQIDQTQPVLDETYYSTSILLFYENWKDGVWSNYGLKLHDVGSNTDAQGNYHSSNAVGTTNDPYLEITYTAVDGVSEIKGSGTVDIKGSAIINIQ